MNLRILGEGVPMNQTDLPGETERALRAITCDDCGKGLPVIKWQGILVHEHEKGPRYRRCAYNPRLLPLFKAATERAAGAACKDVAQSAWQVLGALFGINTPIPRIMNWFHAMANYPVAPDAPLFPLSKDEASAVSTIVAGAYAAAAKQCESDAAGARELIASKTGTKLGNQIAETVAATAEELAKRIRALTPADARQAQVTGETSDGYHTFNELYEHRHSLFSIICRTFDGWKSKLHSDGTMFDGWFIAGVQTLQGQATYHLPLAWWERFACKELPSAPEWDGHTPADVVTRLQTLTLPAAIASAEARARLEGRSQLLDEMILEIKLDGLCMPINHQAMLDYLERLAAARTPDSTKEPE